jgi:hypothetical protein
MLIRTSLALDSRSEFVATRVHGNVCFRMCVKTVRWEQTRAPCGPARGWFLVSLEIEVLSFAM